MLAIAEFNNGPYKAVFPMHGANQIRFNYAACAQTFNNELDCVETVIEAEDGSTPLPLTVIRLSDTFKSVQNTGRSLIGLTFSDKLVSIGNDPGVNAESVMRAVNNELTMPTVAITDADFYGAGSGIELFFTSPDETTFNYRLDYDTQIFRDGELLTVTDNYGSYVDNTVGDEDQYTYTMRAVHPFGQTGDLSEPITVSTTGNNTFEPGTPTDSSRPNKPTGLRVDVYYHDVELFWDRNNTGNVSSYEIRKNGVLVGTTRGVSWYDDTTQNGESYQFDVIAIGNNNEILGIESVRTQIGEAVCN